MKIFLDLSKFNKKRITMRIPKAIQRGTIQTIFYLESDKLYFCAHTEGEEKQDNGTSPQETEKE